MNSKASKIKKIVSAIAIAAVLLGLTIFGFHFSCRVKSVKGDKGNDHNNYARVNIVSTMNFQA